MSGNELRKKYLDYFKERGHLCLPSFSLIPENDPSLLLIGAGMAPLKPYFTGKMKPPCTRITTSQRCVRTGDIENVGRTARHQTFFEMLGNFSFGDYFKAEVIPWAWEFLTKELELPVDKLWVSIYPKDEEAYKIWTEKTSVLPEHIVRMEDNFWEIGSGPCGPDSEIYIDLGEERGCKSPDCAPGCDCDRYLEIWNLVFTQYDKKENGDYEPLAKKNIDTGAGLERLASVLQGKPTNFETDLLFPLIEYASAVSGIPYNSNPQSDISMKVIADHARSIAVMVMDGILPSNEGRGYVLRRILRRAVRHARMLGIEREFLADTVDITAKIYSDAYPDLTARLDYIKNVISIEEKRFQKTLSQGITLLESEIEQLKQKGQRELNGDIAFKLYDTYGFPVELTEEILHENNLELDKANFEKAMQEQRERARSARQENKRLDIPDLNTINIDKLEIDENAVAAEIVCMWKDAQLVDVLEDGDQAGVILDVTPFYAEGGGQIGDSGVLIAPMGKLVVSNTKKLLNGTVYHLAYVEEGSVRLHDKVRIEVDKKRKLASARNHTATHLLQAALKKIVGDHINQAGSSVTPEHLRFDFSSFEPISAEQLQAVEKLVNTEIMRAIPVTASHMSLDEAKAKGAMALFGEKYGDIVRVINVPDFSMELCGGSHVHNTGEIGFFKILSETGVAAGVRRIEAITGEVAYQYLTEQMATLNAISEHLKTDSSDILGKIAVLEENNRELKRELTSLKDSEAENIAQKLLKTAISIDDCQIITQTVKLDTIDDLRNLADVLCTAIPCGAVILANPHDGKLNLIVKISDAGIKRGLHAGKIVKEIAPIIGGKGGGRPNMAQAGGTKPEALPTAFQAAQDFIKTQLQA